MKRAYVAGPYTNISFVRILANVRRGMKLFVTLLHQDYAVYCPFLDYFSTLTMREGDVVDPTIFQANALEWLKLCEIVFVLPGWENSNGTKAEVQWAKENNIQVVYVQEHQLED